MTDEREAHATRRALHRMVLHRRDSIGSAYHVLTFQAERAIDVAAGQFAMVRSETWGAAPLLPRPMSLLTGGERPSILIKVVGEGTRRMAVASGGEPFLLLAPLGKPWSRGTAGRRPVLVAGGVGVAPLLFLAREMAAARAASKVDEGPPALVLYGGRTAADLPLDRELSAVSEMRVATEDGSRGTRGRVTALLAEALDQASVHKQAIQVYTCGPHGMMAAVASMCAERGVPCEVSLETPMGCGYGVCLGCPVAKKAGGFLYACTEGPCVDAAAIDWGHGPLPASGLAAGRAST
jgi:dihydroorotate dehydrogenase electron transfer subunit